MRRSLLTVAVVLLSGCATLAHGRHQEVTILSLPVGARVYRGNVLLGLTPMRATFARRESRLVLTFEKDGYQPASVRVERGKSAWLAGDIAFGPLQFANQGIASSTERATAAVVIPSALVGIDLATGAAFKLPKEVRVELQPLKHF